MAGDLVKLLRGLAVAGRDIGQAQLRVLGAQPPLPWAIGALSQAQATAMQVVTSAFARGGQVFGESEHKEDLSPIENDSLQWEAVEGESMVYDYDKSSDPLSEHPSNAFGHAPAKFHFSNTPAMPGGGDGGPCGQAQPPTRSFHQDTTIRGLTASDIDKARQAKLQHSSFTQLNERSKQRKVPTSRLGRMVNFGGLAVGLGIGALAEVARKQLGLDRKPSGGGRGMLDGSPFLSEANAERIVNTLCKVRGAALKLGQMLSIQDDSLLSPEVQKIFERVRQSADFMPTWQMKRVLNRELGPDWRDRVADFEERPFAAASIGQVHRVTLFDGRQAAMKIQYPGVAQSIENDVESLIMVLSVGNLLPEGLFADSVVEVLGRELSWECDYVREAECTRRFKHLLRNEPGFLVPGVVDQLSSSRVLTTEMVPGVPLDYVVDLPQHERNLIASRIMWLCLHELFEFRFMQTDPNWSNFYYDTDKQLVGLLDFGASRDYEVDFMDSFIEMVHSASLNDKALVLKCLQNMRFLTGYETKPLQELHVNAVMIIGEAFSTEGPFDFGQQSTVQRIFGLMPTVMQHRLAPPPEESYSLLRKLSGAFLICSKLHACIPCKDDFDTVYRNYWEKRHAQEG
uniref:atypical kinase COQ8B, mitochondrial-like isoform X1 n=1 Tax=Myxine glutinosa TaxID=7769 RepID=UPI003590283C